MDTIATFLSLLRPTESLLQFVALGSLAIVTLYVAGNEVIRHRSRIPGLKGPKGWPVVGNLLDILSNAPLKYQEWAKEYGSVFQVQLGNTTVVVVGSAKAARALWISHAQALSSRPITYTFHKLAASTAGLTIGTSPYDDSLKRKKKAAGVALNRPAIQTYVPYLDLETKAFIQDLLTYGEAGSTAINPLPMVQRLSLSLVMTINWGIRIPSIHDPLFQEIVHVEEELNRTRSTVGNIADHIPFLRLNPLSRSSQQARDLRQRRDTYFAQLNADLAAKVARGTNEPCIQASVITYKEAQLNEAELASFSLSVLAGGFETVSNTVQWSIAHLAQHPEIQEKAYAEIRRFQESTTPTKNGSEPLCDAADDQKCAYVHALVKEALRYFSVVPLALPRESIRDVQHEGLVIPAGSTFYMNAWACNRDPELWSDPDTFMPERWLEKPDAPLFTFGLGYRICSAYLLAPRELYLIFMRLLSSFRLEAPEEIKCDPTNDILSPTDLIMTPKPYRVLFIPRNEAKLRESLGAFK